MKKSILFIFAFIFFDLCRAQIDSSEYKDFSLYLYKTEADFFAGKKIYRGQYLPLASDEKIINYTIQEGKKKKLNLEDSCSFYFGYQIGDEIRIRPTKGPLDFVYYVFGGGTINLYCVVYGSLANYDKQGYLQGLTTPGGWIYIYFIDKKTNKNMVRLDELLSSTPELLDAYVKERAKMDQTEWQRYKLKACIKYLKLYMAQSGS